LERVFGKIYLPWRLSMVRSFITRPVSKMGFPLLGALRIPEQDTHPRQEILARKAHVVPDRRRSDSPHKMYRCIRPRSAFFEDVRI
jgi:hypothetical protein